MGSTESADSSSDTIKFTNPLPGDASIWSDGALGPAEGWPDLLKAVVLSIGSFSYPSAIFWDKDLIMLHNQAWEDAGGIAEQGKVQRGSLHPDAWQALQSSMYGGKPTRVSGNDMMRSEEKSRKDYDVLTSPIWGRDDSDTPQGVIAQLIPVKPEEKEKTRGDDGGLDRITGDDTTDDGMDDCKPLDEHPFFHRFAEMLPTGLAILDSEAQAVFVNQHFYELTTNRSDVKSFKSWPQSIHPGDYDRVLDAYHEAFKSQKQLRTEFRALGASRPWRLLLLTPLGDDNLRHVSLEKYGGFICCVVDITSEKSAEETSRKEAKDAEERKTQQERFIDMISHEIRNPLSAILHCIDDIQDAVKDKPTREVQVDQVLEATETIGLCISHQKSIVDDVLSYSKLDSSMLALSPKPCRPDTQLADTLKMFQPELRKQKCQFDYCVDTEYRKLEIDWVMADLGRVGQVLINLVTNAIKFTSRKDGDKKISCRVAASKQRPSSYPPDVVFFKTEAQIQRLDSTSTKDFGDGEFLYIMVAVKDTGIGISDEGQKQLFERFKQATPKTGEIYGGSGLGLNISRKLVHLHGGEIGVASKEGQGATFGFFFRVRRTKKPGDFEDTGDNANEHDERFRSQTRSRGMIAPSKDEIDEKKVPLSLRDLPIKSVRKDFEKDQKEDAKGTGKGRHSHSAELANEVSQEGNDDKQKRQKHETADCGSDDMKENATTPKAPHDMRNERDPRKTADDDSLRILLVEDNIINQKLLVRKLGARGFNITTANNGKEAVEAVARTSGKKSTDHSKDDSDLGFDCVLMDKEMPIKNGNTAAREIRELEREHKRYHLPILGVTANVRSELKDEMKTSGMDDVITKPYKIEELVDMVKALVKKYPR